MKEWKPVKGGKMICCSICGNKAIEEIHKPCLPFADKNGNIQHDCYVCHRMDWDEAARIFGTTNLPAKSAGEVVEEKKRKQD